MLEVFGALNPLEIVAELAYRVGETANVWWAMDGQNVAVECVDSRCDATHCPLRSLVGTA